jgi:virginiamycin B lyase
VCPTVIAPGPDRALWFTRSQDHRIGRITVDGEMEAFRVPTPDSGPFGITAGPDDAMLFTQMNTDRIGRTTGKGDHRVRPSR